MAVATAVSPTAKKSKVYPSAAAALDGLVADDHRNYFSR